MFYLTCFDVLMSHPKPRSGESLTGYSIFLCDQNEIASLDEASLLFFPFQSRRIIKFMKDYPPLHLGHLARISCTSETRLRQATFDSIGRKFGRSTHPQALSRFLGDAISPYLRICPPCMGTNPYHRITWRFSDVLGCLEHGCHLVDTCHNCGRKLPLFRAPFKLGRCPYCGSDLAQAKASPMNAEEHDQTAMVLDEIEFLLTPADWEDRTDVVIKSVGRYLMMQRENLNKSREEFAQTLELSESMLTGIELARFSTYGATFPAYKAYAEQVGTSLKTAFLAGMTLDAPLDSPVRPTGQALIDKAQSAIDKLSRDNTPITGKAVANQINIPRSTLTSNQTIANMIATGEAERLRKIEANLLIRATQFLQDIYVGEGTCSQDALAEHLGISRAKLRRTEQLMVLLHNQHQTLSY